MATIWGKAHKIFLACVSRTVRHRIKICNVTHSVFLSVRSGRGNKHFFLMRKSKFCAISVKSSWHLQRSKSWHFSWLGFFPPLQLWFVLSFYLPWQTKEKCWDEDLAYFLIILFLYFFPLFFFSSSIFFPPLNK